MNLPITGFSSPRVCVIGGGISGLSVASMLLEKGIQVALYEQKSQVGGLVRCTVEHGHLFHRVGGHVFNTKNKRVADWFWSKFDISSEFISAKRKAAIYLKGNFIDYPIELNLAQLGEVVASEVINELIELIRHDSSCLKVSSFQEFIYKNFGKTLARLYFNPYNTKIWRQNLADIPLDWLDEKLPMIAPKDILLKNVLKTQDKMVHSSFFYPIRGGSQFIADRIGKDVHIVNKKVDSIEYLNKAWRINGANIYSHVVFTGDLRSLPSIMSGASVISGSYYQSFRDCLPSHGTTTMLCECDKNEYSWIYIPDESLKVHRIIMTGNFSRWNNSHSLPDDRSTCTVEVSGHIAKEDMVAELAGLPFNLLPIAYNYCADSYVVHSHSTKEALSAVASDLSDCRLYLCGRFAEWKYYNMDAAIEAAMRTVEQILDNS